MIDSSGEPKYFLFLEMLGELVCIDLSANDDGCSYSLSSPPPSAPIRYRLDLKTKGYPMGLRHVEVDDKHYLLGGVKANREGYSDEVYLLDTDRCRTSDEIIQDPSLVLKRLEDTRLKEGKFARVFNLKGKQYLLHDMYSHDTLLYVKAPRYVPPSVPFERLDHDATPFSSHQALTPSLHDILYSGGFFDPSQASNHFIVDDKLVLFGAWSGTIQLFTPPDSDDDRLGGEWNSPEYLDYHDVIDSFYSLAGSVPTTGIFLSDFVYNDGSPDSLGILLCNQTICEEVKEVCDSDDSAILIDHVCAYVICRETFKPKYFQKLDGVYHDLYGYLHENFWFVKSFHHVLDLGKGPQDSRRICAILVVNVYDDDDDTVLTPYLFVSFFNVQLIEPLPHGSHHSHKFLTVSSPIKKLVFQLDNKNKPKHALLDAFLV